MARTKYLGWSQQVLVRPSLGIGILLVDLITLVPLLEAAAYNGLTVPARDQIWWILTVIKHTEFFQSLHLWISSQCRGTES